MSSFLKLEGITGESEDLQHRGEFEIEDANFGSNGVFGKNPVPEKRPIITIRRRVQKDSGKLFLACASGTIFRNGKITLDAGNRGNTVKMTEIFIESHILSGNSQDRQMESLSLAVEKYSVAPPK